MTKSMMLFSDQVQSKFDWFPESASTFSEQSDGIFWFITWTCVFFFVGIVAALAWFSVKYRKPKGGKAESQIDHNTAIELVWSVGPCFLLIAMFYVGAKGFLDQRTVPEGAYNIGVQAFKWGWTMDYGSGVYHPELHVLVNQPTKLTMRSSDVIHSLYIPSFRVKKDVVPGRYSYMWFNPTIASEKVDPAEVEKKAEEFKKAGAGWNYDDAQFTPDGYKFYDLYCTEYCGKDHSQMQTVVVVHETQEDLDAWIKKYSARGDDESLVSYGEKLYARRNCKGCHSLDGSKQVGPSYQGSFGTQRSLASGDAVTVDENYLRESILYPKAKVAAGYQPVMPSYKGQLSDDDIASLVEFIKAQSPDAAAAGQKDTVKEDAVKEDTAE
ncbi:cytochrome c oxidase subunit II [Stieleria varia]|uniref:Cytochrome c oxidase subunit 2 n=1 Tax=Stieleria varia TaxID=2528005 RepID=A0A5C6AZL3_9BACT|nr:cytochrome c oxidase subunit II [Stieleria varia]TWU04957.1 Cytochrome c oxidase subunit 2 precursor [Stieleria varia]